MIDTAALIAIVLSARPGGPMVSAVAGISLKSDARAALQKQMDTGAGAMRYIMAVIAG